MDVVFYKGSRTTLCETFARFPWWLRDIRPNIRKCFFPCMRLTFSSFPQERFVRLPIYCRCYHWHSPYFVFLAHYSSPSVFWVSFTFSLFSSLPEFWLFSTPRLLPSTSLYLLILWSQGSLYSMSSLTMSDPRFHFNIIRLCRVSTFMINSDRTQ